MFTRVRCRREGCPPTEVPLTHIHTYGESDTCRLNVFVLSDYTQRVNVEANMMSLAGDLRTAVLEHLRFDARFFTELACVRDGVITQWVPRGSRLCDSMRGETTSRYLFLFVLDTPETEPDYNEYETANGAHGIGAREDGTFYIPVSVQISGMPYGFPCVVEVTGGDMTLGDIKEKVYRNYRNKLVESYLFHSRNIVVVGEERLSFIPDSERITQDVFCERSGVRMELVVPSSDCFRYDFGHVRVHPELLRIGGVSEKTLGDDLINVVSKIRSGSYFDVVSSRRCGECKCVDPDCTTEIRGGLPDEFVFHMNNCGMVEHRPPKHIRIDDKEYTLSYAFLHQHKQCCFHVIFDDDEIMLVPFRRGETIPCTTLRKIFHTLVYTSATTQPRIISRLFHH